MNNPEPMSPDDIQKFVDGRLNPDQQVRMEAWLADHPEDAALVHAYRLQNTSLKRTFDPVLDEPVPAALEDIVTVRAAGDGSKNTEFRFEDDNGTSAFYWIEANYAYALVAPIKRAPLLDIANRIYKELNP